MLIDHPIHIDLIDQNDNTPRWNQTDYRIQWQWHRFQGASPEIIRLLATDADEKENGRIRYTIRDTADFHIDPELGILSIADEVRRNIHF